MYPIILCSLLLTGCGLAGADSENLPKEGAVFDKNAERDVGVSTEDESEGCIGGDAEDGAENSAAGDTESAADSRSAEEILEEMMADKGFRIRVRHSAGIGKEDTQEIVEQKLEQCEKLELRLEDIYSLEDLRFLPSLKALIIEYSEWTDSRIEDFTPIADLPQLEYLYIKYPAQELDLSFLAQMDTVTELFLVNDNLKDVSFLAEMPQLRCLSLYQTPVDDLAVLENMPELVELSLYGNREAEHIETVGKLLKMQDLGLQDCGISDISFLSSLTELRGVNLNYNSVADLSPLAGLSKLERLGLAENEVSDLSPIAGLENLYDLALDGNGISDISALSRLSRLNQAGLSDNQIRDFSPLADKPELLYASVYGNPCTDLEPVAQVPLLYFGGKASEEQLKIVSDWMEKQRPDVEEYRCIGYSEADLNGDGLTDAAFVVNGEFWDGDGILAYNNSRRMFILLQQKDGSWRELENSIRIMDPDSGGMRGDPYQGMWMGDGQVLVKQGRGSSTGSTYTEIYRCRQGSLELIQTVEVYDCNWAYGYEVTVHDEGDGTWDRYAIAMEDYRMVKVDLASDEYPGHKAFPRLQDLYYGSYYIYPEGLPVNMDAVAALEYFRLYVRAEVKQEPLPYASWQKEGYELLKGVELPDYYYVVRKDDGEADTQEAYIYYLDLEIDDGEYYHVIRYERGGRTEDYRIKDSTGELEEV